VNPRSSPQIVESPTPVFGRDGEIARIRHLVDHLHERGGALVVRGDAGIGKSSILAAATEAARARGISILATAGVESEAHLPFAGLHQLLRSVLGRADALPIPQREALLAAFGMTVAAAPDPFLIALATLELLVESASESGVLAVISDAHWLDEPTAKVVAFVARRAPSERLLLLIEVREGHETGLTQLGAAEMRLEPLDRESSAAALLASSPELSMAMRDRVLRAAEGNPLALVELPIALRSGKVTESDGVHALPLTERLERAFAARLRDLPRATGMLITIAAEDDEDQASEMVAAANLMLEGSVIGPESFEPAVAAGLLRVEQSRVRFRHPLVRSAIQHAATQTERRQSHAALASTLVDQPDRQIWHRAAAAAAPDEDIADELERAAARAQRRGGVGTALAAFERASELTPDPSQRALRLLRTAELAIELGQPDRATRLVNDARSAGLQPSDLGRARLVREFVQPDAPGDPANVLSLVDLAVEMKCAGDGDTAIRALQLAAAQSWWADPGAPAREAVAAAAMSMETAEEDPRVLSILGFVDPEGRGSAIVERAIRLKPDALEPDAADLVGVTLNLTGAFDLSAAFLASAVSGLRLQGRLGRLPQVLTNQAWTAINTLDWSVAVTAAEEGSRLARETAQPLWEASSVTGQAMIAGLRGDADAAYALLDDAEAIALPLRAGAVLAGVQLTRGVTSLAAGRYGEAFEYLRRMLDPSDPSFHHFQASWGIGDFAEAAARTGHADEGRERVAELEPLADEARTSWLTVGLLYARPLLANDRDAETLFKAALATDLSGWPAYRSRLLLQYGSWLRRRRRIIESRSPLRDARDAFDRHGLLAWAELARRELRASGEASDRPSVEAWVGLSPQELQIALMAAEGLTNDEIGQRLFLSRRTVSSHLYRVFPKLGITSRSQLTRVLGQSPLSWTSARPPQAAPSVIPG
jgi:DNA-binding CsgD family transcriptional regulator